jgi:hypothetical protein
VTLRRPKDAPAFVPGNRPEAVLNFMVHSQAGYVARNRIEGVRFEATDIDWNSGDDGLVVRGSADALIRAMSGRTAALDELEGDGVEVLRMHSE